MEHHVSSLLLILIALWYFPIPNSSLSLTFDFFLKIRRLIILPPEIRQVDHDDPENADMLRFNALWEAHYRHDSLLVYCTGRSYRSYLSLRNKKPLLTPDIAITSVGCEIVYGGESPVSDHVWEAHLDDMWNRDIVLEETSKFPQLEPQVDDFFNVLFSCCIVE